MLPTSNIRNFPAQCASTQGISPILVGDFGPSTVTILSWTASPPLGLTTCQGYVQGSTMTVQFSEITNRAGFPRVAVTRQQLDALFSFYYNIGSDYTGQWTNDATLVITITNPFGATPPQIGQSIAVVKASANLRSVPPITAACKAASPPMVGKFGPGNIQVTTFRGSDPSGKDNVFGTGDVIDVVFNIPTNKANLPSTGIKKQQLDKLFQFSHSLGTDYTGGMLFALSGALDVKCWASNGTDAMCNALCYHF